MSLLIVESPVKARKIQKFLQEHNITVMSTRGHINDLETDKLDDMIHNDFTPSYRFSKDKSKVIKELKQVGKGKEIILAADDDREGDAIAWHCGNLLKVDYSERNRITFNEVSKKAIEKALQNKHHINMNSVNAQRCRQLLDLMIGYKLSPLLWKHIKTDEKGLSAGRVQSTLLRMLQDHEDTIKNYDPDYSYDFTGQLYDIDNEERILDCEFYILDKYYEMIDELDCEDVLTLFTTNRTFTVSELCNSKEKRSPPQPFITSTLQQAAQNECGFPIKMTMDIAQKLFDNGKITYTRTDSTYIEPEFKHKIKRKVEGTYGQEYYRNHKPKKVKASQEAHECIRPQDLDATLSDKYTDADRKLYNLIMKRTITSHMKPAVYDVCKINLINEETKHIGYFQGTTKALTFEGFLKYNGAKVEEKVDFTTIQRCHLTESEIKEAESNPPQYYNESTIVKKLESSGVGRPSTYASIISTLYNRKYTITCDIPGKKKEEPYYKLSVSNEITKGVHQTTTPVQKKRIRLTKLGEVVLEYLLKSFSDIICIDFTAQVESDLDLVSHGNMDWKDILKKIYDSFNPIFIRELGQSKVGKYQIKDGKFGHYFTYKKKNYSLSSYLTMKKMDIEELTEKDMDFISQYPKKVGTHKGKDVTLHIGQHSIYMKHNDKNYRLDKVNDYSLSSLSSLL